MLSRCASSYALVLTNPLAAIGLSPCIPDSQSAPSFKTESRTRFEFTIGTNGSGGCAVWPMRMLANDDLVNGPTSYCKIISTTSAYASLGAQFATASNFPTGFPPAGTTNIIATTSLFTQQSFSAPGERTARLVGSGVRFGYTGPVTSQKGMVTVLRNPRPTDILTANMDDLNEILSNQDAVRIPVRDLSADGMNGVAYRPLSTADVAITDAPLGPVAISATTSVPARLGYVVLVTGATPGDVWVCDAVSFFECYGAKLPLTSSEGDPVGQAATMAAVQAVSPSMDPRVNHGRTFYAAEAQVRAGSGQSVPGGSMARRFGSAVVRGARRVGARGIIGGVVTAASLANHFLNPGR